MASLIDPNRGTWTYPKNSLHLRLWVQRIDAVFSSRACRGRRARAPAMTIEALGWASSCVLVLTIGAQVYKQWHDDTSKGVSPLLSAAFGSAPDFRSSLSTL